MKKDILERKLENLEIPDVEVPSHKARLLSELLDLDSFKKHKRPLQSLNLIHEVFYMFTFKLKYVVPAFMVLFVSIAYLAFFNTPKAMAYLTLEVNPAVELTIGKDGKVIDAKSLNTDAAAVMAGIEVKSKDTAKALKEITGVMIAQGFVKPDREFYVSLRPADKADKAVLAGLAGSAESAIKEILDTSKLDTKITGVVITQELFDFAMEEGLLPSSYAELIEEDFDTETVIKLLSLGDELQIEAEVFKDEFETIAAAFADMTEEGLSEEEAFRMLSESIKADPSLEELTTITAAVVDMHEAGVPADSLLAMLSLGKGEVFLEEITTLTAALIDAHEAGISAEAAIALIKEAMAADPSHEEVSTIAAALIDLVEEGMTKEEALKKVKAAMEADPTLEEFDDLIEEVLDEYDDEDGEEAEGVSSALSSGSAESADSRKQDESTPEKSEAPNTEIDGVNSKDNESDDNESD